MKNRLLIPAFLATTAFAMAACTDSAAPGGDATTPDADGDPTEQAEAGELRTVRVAALPIAETGAIWAAIDEGIFEEHGLDVEVVPAQGGAQAIPALLNGDIEFAIGQPFGPFRADLQDLGIVLIGDYAQSHADGDDVNSVVAAADSGIERPADLEGKRVGVNSLGAAGDLTIMKAVDDDGGDPSAIEFVEVGFPEVPGQLDAGNLDAAWVPDPFRGQIVADGGVDIMSPYQETIPGLTVLTNITSAQILDEDPELVSTWAAALDEALAFAEEDEAAVRAAIAENLEIPQEVVDGIVLPEFTSELDRDDLQALAELAVEYEVLDAVPDFDRLVQQQ